MRNLRLFRVSVILKNRTKDIESRVNVAVHIAKIIHMIQDSSMVPKIQAVFRRRDLE
jgi:hypothetical protein